METKVANIRTHPEGPDTVYIGRAGKGRDGYFGNPFRVTNKLPREKSLLKYVEYLIEKIDTDPEFKRRLFELQGKTLLCFCKPKLCHGDYIAAYIDWIVEE